METPSFLEDHISQIPAIQLLINMGYNYVNPDQAMEMRGGKTSQVLFESVLREQLAEINKIHRKGKQYDFSDSNINSAILTLKDLPIQKGFIESNAAFYDLITLGKSYEQSIDGDKKSHTIHYIDWKNPENNVYHVTEEYSVARTARTDHYRPDLVLFINGIPTVVIECKTPSLKGTKSPTELAIEQHIRNFKADGIRSLYMYSSILMSLASNDGRYATTGTTKEFWSKWKERFSSKEEEIQYTEILKILKNKPINDSNKDSLFSDRFKYVRNYFDGLEQEERLVTTQDELIYSLCQPHRLLDVIRNYTIYDDGIKKVARYQQFFGVKSTLERITKYDESGKRKGGVIWHTQGSGKSLTMVMLAQLIASNDKIPNPKIILVTDRVDLDDQISDTFKKCQKDVIQAKTGSHLAELLSDSGDAIITTIINKFEAAVKQTKKPFTSKEIFVLIDEGHRTQYGTFNVRMQQAFPNACFLAFTGTPLMKKERSTANKFGGYIGLPYTVRDAVADGAVVPLLYEGRHNLITVNEKAINHYFEKLAQRKNLTKQGKIALKKRFNTIGELNKADKVIYARAVDISDHYTDFFQTTNDKYKPKAQLVAPCIKSALLYKRYLDDIDLVSSEVVVSESDNREGHKDGFYEDDEEQVYIDRYFNGMKDKYGSLAKYEKSIVSQFKKRDKPEILIVVAKLLTGFDAPNNTVLYLCRSLKEHTLLQAIARVNRVFPGKDYGYIIDYYGNLENLDTALSTYSGLEGFNEEDLEDMVTNVNEEVDKLSQYHADLWAIFTPLRGKKVEPTAYEEFLSEVDIRHRFYEKLSIYARTLKMALASIDFVNNTDQSKIDKYKKDVKFFLKLRADVKRRYNDELSYKEYEPQIQKLINSHLTTDGEILKITELVDIFDQDQREAQLEKIIGKAAKADHIASRTIKAINIKMQEDPVYYRKLADLIKETIQEYHQRRIDEAEYLKRVQKHEETFFSGRTDGAPAQLKDNDSGLAFYNQSKDKITNESLSATNFHIETALGIDAIVKSNVYRDGQLIVEWEKKEDLKGKINIDSGDMIYDLYHKYDADPDWDEINTLIKECLKIAELKYR